MSRCIASTRCRLLRLARLPLVLGMALFCGRTGYSADLQEATPEAAQPATNASQAKKTRTDEDYLRLFKLFAESFDQIDRNYVKEVDQRRLMEAAIRGMLSELDPYSSYITPQQLLGFKTGVENEFGGVGIQVSLENGQLIVLSPLVGSPAYRAGLLPGDRILEIDGKTTEGIGLDDAVRRMQGKIGESVTIKVIHRQKTDAETVKLQRELIRLETVLGDSRNADDSWKWMYEDKLQLGYVRLTAFGRHTGEELKKALEELTKQQMRGLILDLRFNPGGLLPVAVEVSDLFIASGRIVSTEGRNTKPRVWDAHKEGTFEGFPMAVLVNRYSASASEIVAACLQDHNRAVVIGERTWGKGSVQNVVELEDGGSILKLTTADYHRPSGKNIHRFPDSTERDEWGVTPNEGFAIPMSADEMLQLTTLRRDKDIVRKPTGTAPQPAKPEPVDHQLQKALEYLRLKLSAPQPAASAPDKPATAKTEHRGAATK